MSGMTPYEFYDSFVLEDYSDWRQDQSSIRLAFHVAVSALHLADHYCRYYQRTNSAFQGRFGKHWLKDEGLNKFQGALKKRQPSFKPIHEMATAYKHLYTRAWCDVSSGGAIETLKYGGMKIDYDYDQDSIIVIRHRNGSITKFETAISNVIEMWREIMGQEDPSAF